MCFSKIIKFLLPWKSLSEKIDGVLTVEVTFELPPSSCPAWPDSCVCDGEYSWWKALLNFTGEMCVLDVLSLNNRNQRKEHVEKHGKMRRPLIRGRWRWGRGIMFCYELQLGMWEQSEVYGSTPQLLYVDSVFLVCLNTQWCLIILMTCYMMLQMWFLINLGAPVLSCTYSLSCTFSIGTKPSIWVELWMKCC